MTKIREIRCIRTRADGLWLIVKVETDQPGLYGIGLASDYFHPEAVMAAVETMAPRLIGRDVGQIEDIWQSNYSSSYWRNGSILNMAYCLTRVVPAPGCPTLNRRGSPRVQTARLLRWSPACTREASRGSPHPALSCAAGFDACQPLYVRAHGSCRPDGVLSSLLMGPPGPP